MTQQDYEQKEQKKLECYRELKEQDSSGLLSIATFEFIFDRAYAIGRGKETITQEDVEKASVEYADKTTKQYEVCNSEFVQEIMVAFEQGANFALVKQEKEAEYSSLWSRLTDEEKREMQCRYHTNKCVLRDHKKRTGDKAQSKAVARMKLLENLFGKDNLTIYDNE